MGTLKTTNIQSISGSGTVTLGTSGETFTVPSGVTATGFNNPTFMAYRATSQSLTDNVSTKIEFATEKYDSDSTYDNSSNYRWTPGVAGKMCVYGNVGMYSGSAGDMVRIMIYKNGAYYSANSRDYAGYDLKTSGVNNVFISLVDDCSASDYYEIYARSNNTGGGAVTVDYNATSPYTFFGGYRIGT